MSWSFELELESGTLHPFSNSNLKLELNIQFHNFIIPPFFLCGNQVLFARQAHLQTQAPGKRQASRLTKCIFAKHCRLFSCVPIVLSLNCRSFSRRSRNGHLQYVAFAGRQNQETVLPHGKRLQGDKAAPFVVKNHARAALSLSGIPKIQARRPL